MGKLWTLKDLADYLGYGVVQTRRFVRRESIPRVDVGGRKLRFDPEAVRRWAESRMITDDVRANRGRRQNWDAL